MIIYEVLEMARSLKIRNRDKAWLIRLKKEGETFSVLEGTIFHSWCQVMSSKIEWNKFRRIYARKESIWDKNIGGVIE